MATPWETIKQQQLATPWENKQKLWIAPQGFKGCGKTTNNITALSPSWPVIARSAAQSEFEGWLLARQSNPKLSSTVPKTMFRIAPQTFMRIAIPVRDCIGSFPKFRSRTVFVLPFYPRWHGPKKFCALIVICFGTAYPGLFRFIPVRGFDRGRILKRVQNFKFIKLVSLII